ncbi:MAG TPA: PEP/pyruvate-binding domain-containing protein, partial [Bacteroidales bacterium]|nr:PEP/pyruvate-binding domain-containing protein [Bacteroidales bacterium]
DVILVNGTWGLGENVVQGTVQNDEFYLFKKGLKEDQKAIISKKRGSKKQMMVYDDDEKSDETIKNTDTPEDKQKTFCLSDDELTELGKWCIEIEDHYEKPMDIEWAKDGDTKEMYIVQARPETVHSSKERPTKFKKYSIHSEGNKPVITGIGIGDKIASGKVKVLDSPEEAGKIEK